MRKRDDAAPGLSGAQLEIMNEVWDRGPAGATVAEVWAALAARRPVARNTVQTTLVRLEGKGWLTHQGDGAGFRYFARQPRDRALGRLVSRLVDTAFAGSADGLVMALLRGRGVSEAEADRIRAMIDAAERRQP